jgi:hypothetical protein
MNYDYLSEASRNIHLDEKTNVNVAMFFKLLKDSDESL